MIQETQDTYSKISPYIYKTPVEHSVALSQLINGNVHLKLECQQKSGSFKLRGALSKILSVPKSEWNKKFVAVSTGNHAAGFAYAAKKFNLNGEIFLPETVAKPKLEALKAYGIPLKFFGTNSLETEIHASQYARENDCIMVHPYNDEAIVRGQGTIGLELTEQLEKIDIVLVPVGGGGLISGIASYLKSVNPNIEIIGCQPAHSPEMYESIKAGKIITMENKPTLSDATAGGMEPDSITFEYCQKYVDDYIILSEEEIKKGILFLLEKQYLLAEGSSSMPAAAIMKMPKRFEGKNVVCLVTGKKISFEILKKILS